MTKKYSVLLRLGLFSGLALGCTLPEPYEFGEPCEGMTGIYFDVQNTCSGESCQYAKYIEFQICPKDYPYCIRSAADNSVVCALECVKDTFQRDTVPEEFQSADNNTGYCQTSTLKACGGAVDCEAKDGWKSGECIFDDGKAKCVATECNAFYKKPDKNGECKPYANCCGTSCGNCAKPRNSGMMPVMCAGIGPNDGCVTKEEDVANCSIVENGSLVQKGHFCGAFVDENGQEVPNTGVFICPLHDGDYCGTKMDSCNDLADLKVCASNEFCDNGICTPCPHNETGCGNVSCEAREHVFSGKCEEDSVEHCGSHENNCLENEGVLVAECSEEQKCVVTSCRDGYTLHDNECVQSVHCCGTSCADCSADPEKPFCSGNECVSNCPETEGIIVCDGTCIDSTTSLDYCGATSDNGVCTKIECGDNSSCIDKVCTCNTGWHEYDGSCEEDTVEHCGTHETNCLSNKDVYRAECKSAACVISECRDGFAVKDDACVPKNTCCGTSCTDCSATPETPFCLVDSCVEACNPDESTTLISCSYSCIDAKTSNSYCGATSTDNSCVRNDCSTDRQCTDGECKCLEGFHDRNGVCEEDSVKQCGDVGISCLADPSVKAAECDNGKCKINECHDGYILVEGECIPTNKNCGTEQVDCTDTDKPYCLNGQCVAQCVAEEPEPEPEPDDPTPDDPTPDDPAPDDPAPSDPEPKPVIVTCSHACIDVSSSNSYCGIKVGSNGVCRPNLCTGELKCINGKCGCPNEGDIDCDGHCVPGNTLQHCGSCALDCTAIPGVGDVTCNLENARCDISSCADDYHLAKNDDGESLNRCDPDSVTSCGADAVDCTGKFENAVPDCASGSCTIKSCVPNFHLLVNEDGSSCIADSKEACGADPVLDCTTLEGWVDGSCEQGACVASECSDGYNLDQGSCVPAGTPEPED